MSTRRQLAIGALVTSCVVAHGCAQTAVLELEIDLPVSPDGEPLFAVVFAGESALLDNGPESVAVGLPLSCERAEPRPRCDDRTLSPECSATVSIVGRETHLEEPLPVHIRFCDDPVCAGEEPRGSHRIEVERAFYLGRYTQARTCIDEIPDGMAEPQRIERCDVRCREGTATMSCRLDGTHFCEG